MTDPDFKDVERLEALFADVRDAEAPTLSSDLTARLLADAQSAQSTPQNRQERARWRTWIGEIGGWPSVGGLVTAGIAGLWIGIAPSAMAEDLWASLTGESYEVAILSDWDVFEVETDG